MDIFAQFACKILLRIFSSQGRKRGKIREDEHDENMLLRVHKFW